MLPPHLWFSDRTQARLIAGGYLITLLGWAHSFWSRHLADIAYPEEASGGMRAFGDFLADSFFAAMLMVPSFFALRLMSKSKPASAVYAKFLFWLSLTAPGILALCQIGPLEKIFGTLWMVRLAAAPFLLVIMGLSRWFAHLEESRHLTARALMIEGAALAIAVATIYARS